MSTSSVPAILHLYDLAYYCHVYAGMTDNDRTTEEARRLLQPFPDLLPPDHRDVILDWLRDWGCRHLARSDHHEASMELRAWAHEHLADLHAPERSLDLLSHNELASLAKAYVALASRRASRYATFGAVAAAKILFLLRPSACPPWDTATGKNLGYNGSAAGYLRYLTYVAHQLRALANEAGVPIAAGVPSEGV